MVDLKQLTRRILLLEYVERDGSRSDGRRRRLRVNAGTAQRRRPAYWISIDVEDDVGGRAMLRKGIWRGLQEMLLL
jgi:hypothetical protein